MGQVQWLWVPLLCPTLSLFILRFSYINMLGLNKVLFCGFLELSVCFTISWPIRMVCKGKKEKKMIVAQIPIEHNLIISHMLKLILVMFHFISQNHHCYDLFRNPRWFIIPTYMLHLFLKSKVPFLLIIDWLKWIHFFF